MWVSTTRLMGFTFTLLFFFHNFIFYHFFCHPSSFFFFFNIVNIAPVIQTVSLSRTHTNTTYVRKFISPFPFACLPTDLVGIQFSFLSVSSSFLFFFFHIHSLFAPLSTLFLSLLFIFYLFRWESLRKKTKQKNRGKKRD